MRPFSSISKESYESQVDALNEKFAEARDEIEYAQEDAETTYFNESAETARTAVNEVLKAYTELGESLAEDQRGKLQRSMGLKMEQLKAEIAQLDHLHA